MRKIFKNRAGFSFIELIIAVAIIIIISSVFIVNVRLNTQEDVRTSTEKLAADIRYIRNLAVSRAEYQFADQTADQKTYPAGGYGIFFYGSLARDKYFIFADDGTTIGYQADSDEILYEVEVYPLLLDDQNGPLTDFWFTFISENQVVSSMGLAADKKYMVNLRENIGTWGTGYQGSLVLGEVSSDGYVWSNIGTSYSTFSIAKPAPLPKDPEEAMEI
ncbi:hypothetical protein C4566_00660 [Candidatus Parcubacteria bacterium]|nr:MAG: hypothetical protein C4566_00660 [Candidatus Parcubacteria bacterium]